MRRGCSLLGILCLGLCWSHAADAKPRASRATEGKHTAPTRAATTPTRASLAAAPRAAPAAKHVRNKKKSPPVVKAAVRAHHEDAAPTSFFLAANPHVPLAVVREGAVREAVARADFGKSCGPKRRWATEGTSWHALDAWGKLVGTATVDVVEDYDVTKCGEVYFAPKFDRTNTMLFVSADSAYVPGTSLEWVAPANAQWRFLALLGKQAATTKRKLPFTCTEIQKPARFFHAGDAKLAVGGADGALLIAAFDGTTWKHERLERSQAQRSDAKAGEASSSLERSQAQRSDAKAGEASSSLERSQAQRSDAKAGEASSSLEHASDMATCYRPVSVLDMNGDGRPEVVVREVFGDGEGWHDVVFTRDANGHWSLVAVSPGGSTA